MATILDAAALILEVEAWLREMLCLKSPSSYTSKLGIQSRNVTIRGALSSRDGLGQEVCYVRIPQCLLTFWPGLFFVVGNYPVHCKMFTTSSVSTH